MSVQLLVDRAIVIRARIAADAAELKAIEKKLVAEALAHPELHVDLEDAEREDRKFLAHGETLAVPIIFTADALVKSFRPDSAQHVAIADAANGRLSEFYKFIQGYEAAEDDGKIFRARAREVLGENAPAFITACLQRDKFGIPKSATKIEWDHAKPVAKGAA